MSRKSRLRIVLLGSIFFPLGVHAFDYPMLDSIKSLDEFDSVVAFENAYQQPIQKCLDNTYGGSAGIPCLIEAKIWDRELNLQYQKLYRAMDEDGKRLLKDSQRSWLAMRDDTYTAQSHLMDKAYPSPGTMFALMRAGSVDELAALTIKQRALLLRDWYRLLNSQK